jgi:hypothetical protein
MTAKYDYSLPASCRANLGYAPEDADRTRARAEERVHRPLAHPDAMESVPIWSFFQSAGTQLGYLPLHCWCAVNCYNEQSNYPLAQGLIAIGLKQPIWRGKTVDLQPTDSTT